MIIWGLIASTLLGGCMDWTFYHPDHVLYGTPASEGLHYEDVAFQAKDGTRLSGWFIPAAGVSNPHNAKGTVIYFHGNAQDMSFHWRFVSWLPRRGFNVFIFDYRGYGKSEGAPDPGGLFDDSNSALDYVRARPDVDPNRLLVFGQSLGGTNAIAAIGAGNRSGVRAVAIEATFYSYSTIASEKVFGGGLLMDDTYSAANYIARIAPIPLLLLHGTADTVVPYDHSARLFAMAGEPKNLIAVEGGGHIEAMTPRFGTKYQDALIEFFGEAMGGSATASR